MSYPVLNGAIKKMFNHKTFVSKKGFYGQKYYSAFIYTDKEQSKIDREITIDDLSGVIMVCVSTPPLEGIPGEIVKSWNFDDEVEAMQFIKDKGLLD